MLKKIHKKAESLFKKTGFEWQVLSRNGAKIGVWRKKLKKKKSEINTRNDNSAKTVLAVIPGFGDTSLSWLVYLTPLIPFLKRKFDEVVIFDFAGFLGFLSEEQPCPTMDHLLEALNGVLDEIRPHTVLAHSLGGWLAAKYALWSKDQKPPEQLVLVCPAGVILDDQEKHEWGAMYEEVRAKGFQVYRKRLFEREPFWFRFFVGEFESFLQKQDVHDFMISIRWDHFLSEELKELKSKVWIVWGEKDTIVKPHWAKDWVRKINHGGRKLAHAVLIKGAGHTPHAEKTIATTAVLTKVLMGQKPPQFFTKSIGEDHA